VRACVRVPCSLTRCCLSLPIMLECSTIRRLQQRSSASHGDGGHKVAPAFRFFFDCDLELVLRTAEERFKIFLDDVTNKNHRE